MIDPDGFRPNVAVVLARDDGKVFWARRVTHDGWQFPQGGIRSDEMPEDAMYRELREETGLCPEHVEVLASTPGWLNYRLPRNHLRLNSKPLCIGQKQVWFLLRLASGEGDIDLAYGDVPEFDDWRWVDYWHPLAQVVNFKRDVYRRALQQLAPTMEGYLGTAIPGAHLDPA